MNIATDSDGELYSGSKVKEVRSKNLRLRRKLQTAGTKSAKRHLRKVSGKESRFMRNINHIVSKRLVEKAADTRKAIALENLKGIRNETTVRKPQRYYHSSWTFQQLRGFIEYKATLMGVPVIPVYPRGTSHICPECGHNKRANRPNRDTFKCVRCGFAGQADHIAAINIAARADVNQPIVSGKSLGHFSSSGTSPLALAVGS